PARALRSQIGEVVAPGRGEPLHRRTQHATKSRPEISRPRTAEGADLTVASDEPALALLARDKPAGQPGLFVRRCKIVTSNVEVPVTRQGLRSTVEPQVPQQFAGGHLRRHVRAEIAHIVGGTRPQPT